MTTWLAMLALVMHALAPAMAQAVVTGSGNSDWVEVCSVSGLVWVKTVAPADGSLGKKQGGGHPMADGAMPCPWCSLHGGAAGLPPAFQIGHDGAAPPAWWPVQRARITATAVWVGALARAPPQLS